MSKHDIKSAQQVVSNFLESLTENTDMDSDTVKSISELYEEGNLTKTRLLRSLDEHRASALVSDASAH